MLKQVEGLQFELDVAPNLSAALERLTQGHTDVVLLDLHLPDSRGLNTFLRVQRRAPHVPVVVMTGFNDEVLAVKAVQEGAEDYLVKGYVNPSLLARSLRYAIERTRRRLVERAVRENAEKLQAARLIQQRLFPQQAARLPGLDLAGASYPAEATGGDYYDYFRTQDGGLALGIGDVTGHGLGPSLLSASLRAYLRALAAAGGDVAHVLTLVNRLLYADLGDDRFVTLFFGRLDLVTRTLTYVSAGHPPGYVLDASGRVKLRLESTALPLAVAPEATYAGTAARAQLDQGDLLLLLTDGVLEERSPDRLPFGGERALGIVRHYWSDPARLIVENLYNAVRAFSQNLPQVDDITAMVVKVTGDR
jgi:phosphoserine phosphatase